MADYAGAVAAMRARFEANWTATPVKFQNETPPTPWPPVSATDGSISSWVYFEVIATHSNIRGAGLPGSQTWLTVGFVYVYVYTPVNFGYPESLRLADLAGEIFRAQTFYQDGAGAKVICMAPQTDGGAIGSEDGNWFRVSVAVPFEFYFLK